MEIETPLKPFIPEYVPATGDIDEFIKVSSSHPVNLPFTTCNRVDSVLLWGNQCGTCNRASPVLLWGDQCAMACKWKAFKLCCAPADALPRQQCSGTLLLCF